MINRLFGALLGIVVGVALLPVVTGIIDDLDTTTMSAAVVSLIDILPILYVIIIVVGAASFVVFRKN